MGNTFEEVKARSKELARKRELSENEEFIARAACMNKVFSVLNEVIPKLQESLSEGYKLKADGSLYAKDEERLKVILDEIKEKYKVEGRLGLNAFLSYSGYGIWLKVSDWYKDSKGSTPHFSKDVVIYKKTENEAYDYEPYELVSGQCLSDAKRELRALQNEKSEIESKISKLKRLLPC
jgi:hypothetical protein